MSKTIIVTGASSGFGRAIARRFARDGNILIITGRRIERLQQLKTELEAGGGAKVIVSCFDIRIRAEVEKAMSDLAEEVEKVDILVNNAGLAAGLSSIEEGDIEDWETMIDTNVKGLLYMTRQIAPLMKAQKGGHIINIGSTAGKQVYKNGNVYCATKFAVDALNQAMRIDLLPYGIKVTAVNPGLAETEFSIVRFRGDEDRAKTVYAGFEPLHAEDIADIVDYCASLPAHVCINDLTVTCTAQANAANVVRHGNI
jgi:3-hydroxy acid dehydrogenase/malonic semialdehyde reductase